MIFGSPGAKLNVACYWAWPGPRRDRVPSSGFRSTRRPRRPTCSRAASACFCPRVGRAARDSVWRVQSRSGLLAPLYALGQTAPARDALGVRSNPVVFGRSSRSGGRDDHGEPLPHWLLVTRGARSINKVVALPFAGARARPLLLVQESRGGRNRIARSRARPHVPPVAGRAHATSPAPRALAVGRVGGRSRSPRGRCSTAPRPRRSCMKPRSRSTSATRRNSSRTSSALGRRAGSASNGGIASWPIHSRRSGWFAGVADPLDLRTTRSSSRCCRTSRSPLSTATSRPGISPSAATGPRRLRLGVIGAERVAGNRPSRLPGLCRVLRRGRTRVRPARGELRPRVRPPQCTRASRSRALELYLQKAHLQPEDRAAAAVTHLDHSCARRVRQSFTPTPARSPDRNSSGRQSLASGLAAGRASVPRKLLRELQADRYDGALSSSTVEYHGTARGEEPETSTPERAS